MNYFATIDAKLREPRIFSQLDAHQRNEFVLGRRDEIRRQKKLIRRVH